MVLAHEIAHHVHGDIWKGIAFESALIVAGFYLASQVLRAMAGAAGLRGVDDVAGPAAAAAGRRRGLAGDGAGRARDVARASSAAPIASRSTLTRNPAAFISAMRRLGAQNLAEEHPSKIVQWLFYSHPPIASASPRPNRQPSVRRPKAPGAAIAPTPRHR